ncbi:MAG: hypothetical protein ABIN01_14755 [Ferruginibacter sp.]
MRNLYKISIFYILLTISNFTSFAQTPKIIEFGWDYPHVDQLSKGLSKMQNTPFDGICFSLQRGIMEAFDTVLNKENYFEYNNLKTLQWGKYTDNFILLLGYGQTGGHWLEDGPWKVIIENMEGLSKAMKGGAIKGILFDPEYYLENPLNNPWTYNKTQYPNHSFKSVQSMVKKRGIQFIRALQKSRSTFSFLSLWMTGLIEADMKNLPLENTRQALLVSFIEGVLEGKNKTVTVIDGNENAYWYSSPSQFLESTVNFKKNMALLMTSKKAISAVRDIELAQPVFYDGLMALAPEFERRLNNINKWKWLEENTKHAMVFSDRYVWFYSQRIDWWKSKPNDTLIQILKNSKLGFNSASFFKKENKVSLKRAAINTVSERIEKGYFYSNHPKAPWRTEQVAFTFQWIAGAKTLQINFVDRVPESIIVFANNILFELSTHKVSTMKVNLRKFNKGKITVLAKYGNGVEAFGVQVYKGQ